MTDPQEERPASVPNGAKQAGEVRSRWGWTEPAIWTDRMLETLETGLKGGKWYSLSDKAFSVRSLEAAFRKVKANGGAAGVDGVTLSRFERNLEEELSRLSQALTDGRYRPQGVRRVWIPKPGSKEGRPLGVPTVRDRVVQTALRSALEPIFEREFRGGSYGFRPGRSCHQALRRVWLGLTSGKTFVADADLKSFFDTIPHGLLLEGLRSKVSDGKLLLLVESYLAAGAWDGTGTPQGSVLSPLLANVALHGLDLLAEELGLELVRYADDFVILCGSREEAASALETVRVWTMENGLSLHPEKTRLVDYGSGESFEFLGYEFKEGFARPRKKSVRKLKDEVRGLTPRNSGRSLWAVIRDLNRVLRGWFVYFRHSREDAFPPLDRFVRQRLRAILCRRRGHGRVPQGLDMIRWPNAYFHGLGLFSTERAHAELQSSRR